MALSIQKTDLFTLLDECNMPTSAYPIKKELEHLSKDGPYSIEQIKSVLKCYKEIVKCKLYEKLAKL